MEQFYYVGFTVLGLILGYFLSRKQQDKPLVDYTKKQKPSSESLLDDPYERAMHTEAELAGQKRIPTMKE